MSYNGAYTGAQVDAAIAKALAMPNFDGEVADFASLPGSPDSGDTYLVLGATGVWPFNRKPAGFYRYNGSAWVHMGWDISSLQTDSNWALRDNVDTTRQIQFELSGITTGNVRLLTVPDKNITIADNADIPTGALADLNTVGTTEIDDDAVTYAKIQNVSATDKLLGRSTAGAGDVEEIACTAAGRSLLDDADAAAQRTTLGLGTIATQAAPSGTVVGTTDTQTLTNKTLTAPVINPAINTQTGTTYTFVLSDASKKVESNNAAANTFTIPTNASVAFPIGTEILVPQIGAGLLTIAGDTGVTVNGVSAGTVDSKGQYFAIGLYKRGTDEWVAIGGA